MNLNKKKILIVDDEPDYCILLKTYFIKKNYEVNICNCLKDLFSYLNKDKADIILLDNNLPDGSGWDRAYQIIHDNPDTKLYLISAYSGRKNFTGTHKNIEIWEKPISFDFLEEVF